MGIKTLDEFNKFYYNVTPDEILKAAGGFSTASTGVYNPIFGAIAWANFNLEANVFSALPKFVWDFSGARLLTGKGNQLVDAGSSNNTIYGGTTEGGLIAASVRPDVKEIYWKPKTIQYPFEVTELQEYLVEGSRDDLWGSLAHQRVYAADQLKEILNQMLVRDPEGYADTTADNLSRLDLETLFRVISSKDEYDQNGGGVTNRFNPWKDTASIARNSATTHDSTVVSPSGDLNTSDVLTDRVIQQVLASLRTAGGKNPTVMIGGQDTYAEVQSIYMNAYRIQNTADIRTEYTATVNGVKTFDGTGVGLQISTIYGIPFIPTKDSPANSATDAGDLLILNTSADKYAPGKPLLGLQTLKPVLYYEASKRQQSWPWVNGAFKDRALYETMLELTCRNFKAQGKIINIAKGI